MQTDPVTGLVRPLLHWSESPKLDLQPANRFVRILCWILLAPSDKSDRGAVLCEKLGN